LYCGDFTEVLNEYMYEGYSNTVANYFLNSQGMCHLPTGDPVPCINKVCVLKYNLGGDDIVIVGASSNHETTNSMISLGAFNKRHDYCKNKGSGGFEYCDGSDTTIWYYDVIESILYGRNIASITTNPTGSYYTYVRGTFNPIVLDATLQNKDYDPPKTYEFIGKTTDFDKIYTYKSNDIRIRMVMEQINDSKYNFG